MGLQRKKWASKGYIEKGLGERRGPKSESIAEEIAEGKVWGRKIWCSQGKGSREEETHEEKLSGKGSEFRGMITGRKSSWRGGKEGARTKKGIFEGRVQTKRKEGRRGDKP